MKRSDSPDGPPRGGISDGDLEVILGLLGADTAKSRDPDGPDMSNAHYMMAIAAYNKFGRGDIHAIDDAAKYIIKACKTDRTGVAKLEAAVDILYHLYERGSNHPHLEIEPERKERILRRICVLGKRAIRLGSRRSMTYGGVGKAYRMRGQYERSIKYFRRALEIDPSNMDAKIVMATAMISIMAMMPKPPAEDYNRTLKDIDDVIASGRFTQMALTTKADMLAAFDDAPNLRKVLVQLERFDPVHAADWMWRGELYLMAGDKRGAERYMNRAREIDPSVRLLGESLRE